MTANAWKAAFILALLFILLTTCEGLHRSRPEKNASSTNPGPMRYIPVNATAQL